MSKIIVIEGVDGSGKRTQAELLSEKFEGSELISFPRYADTFFGKECGKYLNGEYGSKESIDPRLNSLLYALDRFESKHLLIGDKIKILDRYVPTNIAHQCAKINDPVKRHELEDWLEQVEYGVLGLPEPDMVIFLDIPVSVTQELVLSKNKREYTDNKKDLHESDVEYMQNTRDFFLNLCKRKDYKTVSCVDAHNKLRTIEEIHTDVLEITKNYITVDINPRAIIGLEVFLKRDIVAVCTDGQSQMLIGNKGDRLIIVDYTPESDSKRPYVVRTIVGANKHLGFSWRISPLDFEEVETWKA